MLIPYSQTEASVSDKKGLGEQPVSIMFRYPRESSDTNKIASCDSDLKETADVLN